MDTYDKFSTGKTFTSRSIKIKQQPQCIFYQLSTPMKLHVPDTKKDESIKVKQKDIKSFQEGKRTRFQ